MSDPDPELESLMAKRMAEMRSNVAHATDKTQEEKKEAKADPREIVISKLGYRGAEVLHNAEAQHPGPTRAVVAKMAELIESGELGGIISGGDLLALFAAIGIRVRMQTKISVESDGKLVSLSDKLSTTKSGDGAS